MHLTRDSGQKEESKSIDLSNSGVVSTCTNDDTCLLQLQKIKTRKGWTKVIWNNGASLCFITNAKAKAERLKGKRCHLTLVKVGGLKETIETCKYTLPLIDEQGHEVHFIVYGIEKITSDIQSVNMDRVLDLFKDIPRANLARPTGP